MQTNVITERRILNPIHLDVKNDPHPMIQNSMLPAGMFLAAMIGPRASGKTHLTCALIRRIEESGYRDPAHEFRKTPIRTILLSPTADSNPVFKSLKTLDPSDIVHNFTFKAWDQVWGDIKYQKEAAEQYLIEKDIYDRKQAGETISTREEAKIHYLHGACPVPQGRYHIPPVTIVIADDLANSVAFKLGSSNTFTNSAIRNRHFRCCMILCVQHAKSIPRILRHNVSLLAIGKFADSEYGITDLYEFVSSFLTEEQFTALYEKATSEPRGFLCVDCDSKRVTRNFENELIYTRHHTEGPHGSV
jgi:hypothetical protein